MLDIPDGPLAAKVDRLRECDAREQALVVLQIIMGMIWIWIWIWICRLSWVDQSLTITVMIIMLYVCRYIWVYRMT